MFSLNEQVSLWHFGPLAEGTRPETEKRSRSFSQDLGEQDLLESEKQPFSLDGPPTADHPICCWNICANITDRKAPRPSPPTGARVRNDAGIVQVQRAMDGSLPGLASAFQPQRKSVNMERAEAPSGPQSPRPYQHLSRRLLMEPIGPDRHLVFNPLSGAVDLFTQKEWAAIERLQSGRTALLAPAQERLLRERGYLFGSAAEEEEYLEQSVVGAWDRMQLMQPESYTVCPTLACNLACAYCFEGDSLQDKPQGVMTDDQVAAVFATIHELRQEAAQQGHQAPYAPWICLFGGEPLLPSTKRCVSQILRLAAENGFLVGATTNGVNVVRYEALLREYADILTTFQITLDGPQAVHDSRRHRLGGQGTFSEIVRGIDLLLSLGIDVDVRVNLDRTNLAALPELVDFLFEKGWNEQPGFRLALAPVTQHGTGENKGGGSRSGENKTGGCSEKSANVLSELELTRTVLTLLEAQPRLAQVCHLGFLRHLAHLVDVLEPSSQERREGASRRAGPRYWYCEASTNKQFVFTPEGLIYRCTESVGKPQHAIGRFDPAPDIQPEESAQWTGRTILSHPQCRSCPISTLCGGGCHFAARERSMINIPLNKSLDKSVSRATDGSTRFIDGSTRFIDGSTRFIDGSTRFIDGSTLLQIAVPPALSKALPSIPQAHAHASPGAAGGLRPSAAPPVASMLQKEVGNHAAGNRQTEPFCNAAEETVRAYLRHIGRQMFAAGGKVSLS